MDFDWKPSLRVIVVKWVDIFENASLQSLGL